MYLFSCQWICFDDSVGYVSFVLEHDSYDWSAHGQVFKAPDQSPAFQGGLPKQGQLREDSTWWKCRVLNVQQN